LTVRVQIDDPIPDDDGSTVRVALRDTSQADAHHPTVVEVVSVIRAADEPVEIALDVPENALDERHRYSVWTHIDHDGKGELSPGDLITTQNVPVYPAELALGALSIDVPLTRI
jgi:uncharacterized lipoprotein YbaY